MKVLLTLSLILVLSGCATSYQSQGITGGFSETQLDTNVFKINFKGNGFTSPEKASEFTLLRSAELALENGFKYFVIIDSQQYSKDSSYISPTTASTNVNAQTYGTAYNFGNNTTFNANTNATATTTVSGGQTFNISKPRASNVIVCFNEKPEGYAYNSEFVIKSLKQKHGIE